MLNLLRANWLKVKRDKSIKVILIITVILGILNVFVLLLTQQLLKSGQIPEEMGDLAKTLTPSARQSFLNSFNTSNNFGFVIPVVVCLFVGKEFQYGTIRNKLISGTKRSTIYFSNLISAALICLFLIFVYAFTNLFFGIPILGYGKDFNFTEFLFILKTFGLGYLLYLFVITISVFLTMMTRNQTIALSLSLFVLILGSLITSLGQIKPSLKDIFTYIPFYQTNLITMGVLSLKQTLIIIYTNVLSIIILTIIGVSTFKNLDIK